MKSVLRAALTVLLVSLAMPGAAAPPPHTNGHGIGPDHAIPPGPPTPPPAAADPQPATAPAAPPGPPQTDADGAGPTKKDPPSQAKKAGATEKPAASAKSDGKAKPAGPKDQNEAQKAVEELKALPLAKIVKIAEKRDQGKVINARLVRISGVLLYQLTLLNDAGRSWRVYYHAQRGNPVVLP